MKKQIIYKNNPYMANLKELPESIIAPKGKNTKLVSPSTKEWPNSVYNFNKNHIESSYSKLQMVNKIIRSYFNLMKTNKRNKNSKRMRDLIRRSSTKKLFVSKPEIKQYSDKVIYTMYVFNRENNFYSKKIFLLNKSLSKYSKYRMYKVNYLNNLQIRLQLNKIRPLNRLGTINYNINSESEQINKSYLFEPKSKNFHRKNFFLNKLSKGMIYYINSYNIIKQRPLLKLKTKRLKKSRNFSFYLKGLYRKKNAMKRNLFIKKDKKGNSKLELSNYKPNKEIWRSFFKNKATTFFRNKLNNLLPLSIKKKQLNGFRSIFFFNFASWVLLRLNVQIFVIGNMLILKSNDRRYLFSEGGTNKLNYQNFLSKSYCLSSYFYKKSMKRLNLIESKIEKINKILISVNELGSKTLNKTKLNKINKKLIKFSQTKLTRLTVRLRVLHKIRLALLGKIKVDKLNKMNIILFNLMIITVKRGLFPHLLPERQRQGTSKRLDLTKNKNPGKIIRFFFEQFKKKYLWYALRSSFTKQILGMRYLYRHSVNGFKYSKFLMGLKAILLKIFNKSPQINIVNLKYLHLNSDILMESLSIKLKNKKAKLLKTIKRALKLVKIPEGVRKVEDNTIGNRSMFVNTDYNYDHKLQDIINISLTNMFSRSNHKPAKTEKLVNKNQLNGSTNPDIANKVTKEIYNRKFDKLNDLRYKWITGIRIEGKGRLTKRYRADRSVFKFKHKGSLKNVNFKDIYDKKHLSLKKTQSMAMLKGQTLPNIQYAFTKWKRHVGSYGIKGWISNN